MRILTFFKTSNRSKIVKFNDLQYKKYRNETPHNRLRVIRLNKIKNHHNANIFSKNMLSSPKYSISKHLNFIFQTSIVRNEQFRNCFESHHKSEYQHNQAIKSNKFTILPIDHQSQDNLLALIFLLLIIYNLYYSSFAEAQENKDFRIRFQHSLLYLFNGNLDKFISDIIHLSKENENLKQALLYLENGQLKEAIGRLDILFLDELKLPDSYNLIKGIIYNVISDHENAIEHLKKVLHSESAYLRLNANLHLVISLKTKNNDVCEYIKVVDFNEERSSNIQNLYQNLSKLLVVYPFKIAQTKSFFNLITQMSQPNNLDLSDVGNVIIRIWLPTSKKETGHVSLQTETHYISFWPIDNNFSIDPFTNLIIESHIGRFAKHNNIWDDIRDENRLPDARLSLKLDTNAINKAYEEFAKSKYQWSLLGSMFMNSQNCSGLVYYLLMKGGFKLDPSTIAQFTMQQSIVTGTVAAATSTASMWGPLIAYPVKFVPFVGMPLSVLLENAPTLTTGTIGVSGALLFNKTITPDNINLIVTLAFLKQCFKENNENISNTIVELNNESSSQSDNQKKYKI